MTSGLISIIIPTFNRAHLIRETLDSIVLQTYSNWECIIIDDDSTDSTEQLIKDYVLRDNRFRYYKRPIDREKGPGPCRNYGFELSKGKYIQWFDSDDLMLENKLEIDLINILSGDYDFTISQSKFFGESAQKNKQIWNAKLFSDDPINDFVQKKIGWSINAPLWKKEVLSGKGIKFDEKLMTADDYFFHIKALEEKLKPYVNDSILVHLRVHSERLQNFKVKSPYKLKVFVYLLANSEKLNLRENTIEFLKKRILLQLNNLYKNKKWSLALKWIFKLIGLSPKIQLGYLLKVFLKGSFYRLFSRGYKYLN